MSLFSKKTSKIKSAKLLGVRQAEETLLFHTSNFSLYIFIVFLSNMQTGLPL